MNGGERNRHRSTTPSFSNTSAAAVRLADLPEDIVFSILKRLPVKSILRFRRVSKQWLHLFSSPKFISIHLEHTSKNPLNHSFIIHMRYEDGYHELSLLNVNSTERMPVSLFNPFYGLLKEMELVGCVNGLVCLSCIGKAHSPNFTGVCLVWNPAMNLYKPIRLSIPDEDIQLVSLGFAYDSVNDDYKIIRIDRFRSSREAFLRSRAEVYSASLDSWKRVHIDFPFGISVTSSNVIAKGITYWTAFTYQANSQDRLTAVLVYYDLRNGSFKHLPLLRLPPYYEISGQLVEWKGNLGAIVPSTIVDRKDFVDIMVYDEMSMCWNKISSLGPVQLGTGSPTPCSKDGMFLALSPEKKLILYDMVTNGAILRAILRAWLLLREWSKSRTKN